MKLTPILEPILCGEDECHLTELPSSIAFRCGGRDFFLLADPNAGEPDAYYVLKRRMFVTYRIARMEPEGCGVYRVDMTGSDGSDLTIHLTDEDLHHNLAVVEESLQTLHCDCVC